MSHITDREPALYARRHAVGTPEEAQRLDDLHAGITDYLGGALSLAPIKEDSAPKSILELGCGSGAWAIQAAKQFPDAEVLAVDLTPLPPRDLPPNLKFQAMDLTEKFPFDPETFDIIHARFVLIHVTQFENVLSRTIQLVKPGGWLLLEDIERNLYDDEGLGPGQKSFYEALHSLAKKTGFNPLAPATYESLLKESNCFSEINVKKVVVPISKESEDANINKLRTSLKLSLQRGLRLSSSQKLGVAPEVAKQVGEEMDDPSRNSYLHMYFTWSRKRA